MDKQDLLYEGKAKRIYSVKDSNDYCVMTFKDDLTAFDGEKFSSETGKGGLNCQISSELFDFIESSTSIDTHYEKALGEAEMLTTRVDIIPVEIVVRNIVSGSLIKRTGLSKGERLAKPVVEFYYKRDDLKDPMLNRYHIQALELMTDEETDTIVDMALEINQALQKRFLDCGLLLVDFKLEFGRRGEDLLLADEITPDTCRLWDKTSEESLDKDVFRSGEGNVLTAYREIYQRLTGRGC